MCEIRKIMQALDSINIKEKKGMITFEFADTKSIVINKDIIGYTLQDWFGKWLLSLGIDWHTGPHSQSWPDFVLNDNTDLELKTFDADARPNFDVANFDAFIRSLVTGHVHRLNTPHLIFAYKVSLSGEITISNYWLKYIWEITGPSVTNILNLQVKQGVPVNIRPKNWCSKRVPLFTSRREFVVALNQALNRFYPFRYSNWFEEVESEYLRLFGENL